METSSIECSHVELYSIFRYDPEPIELLIHNLSLVFQTIGKEYSHLLLLLWFSLVLVWMVPALTLPKR